MNGPPTTVPRLDTPASAILIVDAKADRRERLAKTLLGSGHRVDTCGSESAAVECLEEGHHQVVVLAPKSTASSAELGMLAWMRVRHPSAQVVVVARPGSGARALRLANSGATALIHTPVEQADLLAAIDRAVRNHELRDLAQRRYEDSYVQRRHLDAMSHVFETALMQLNLAYQPIIRARTGCVVGYEALLRTNSTRLDGAGPMLALARRLGRQSEVDDRVRSLVTLLFEESAQLRTIFVNFDTDELLRGVLGTRQDSLAPYATRVVVEFGDEALPSEHAAAATTLKTMRDRGYRVAAGGIAGTIKGLGRMRALAPDLYKLGAAVVQRSDEDPEKRRHIARLVELAHDEGALVVAQGIERPEEREVAASLGCDMLQGYLLGMPRYTFA